MKKRWLEKVLRRLEKCRSKNGRSQVCWVRRQNDEAKRPHT